MMTTVKEVYDFLATMVNNGHGDCKVVMVDYAACKYGSVVVPAGLSLDFQDMNSGVRMLKVERELAPWEE